MQVTYGVGDCQGFLQRFLDCTAAVFIKCVYHECDVVWRPAEKENHHDSHDDPESLLLLEALVATLEAPQDAGIAEDHDSRRQQEAQNVVEQA